MTRSPKVGGLSAAAPRPPAAEGPQQRLVCAAGRAAGDDDVYCFCFDAREQGTVLMRICQPVHRQDEHTAQKERGGEKNTFRP
jgi:hypothetical protein